MTETETIPQTQDAPDETSTPETSPVETKTKPPENSPDEPKSKPKGRAAKAEPEVQESALVPIYVSSKGIETISENMPGVGPVEYVRGDVNGVPFKVKCDAQILVEPHIAEALKPLIERQRAKR